MEKEKFDLKVYQEWCKKHKMNETDESSFRAYKEEQEKIAKDELKSKKLKEIKEIFDLMVKFTGKDVKFDDRAAGFLAEMYENLVKTVGTGCKIFDIVNEIAKLEE